MPQSDDAQIAAQLHEALERELTGWADPPARLMQALEQDELELFAQPIRALRAPGGFPMAKGVGYAQGFGVRPPAPIDEVAQGQTTDSP